MSKRFGVDFVNEKVGYGLFLKVKGTKEPKLVFSSSLIGDILRYIVQNLHPEDTVFLPELINHALKSEVKYETHLMERIKEKYPESFDKNSEMKQIWDLELYINRIFSGLGEAGDLKLVVGDLANATAEGSTASTEEFIEEFMRQLFGESKKDKKEED